MTDNIDKHDYSATFNKRIYNFYINESLFKCPTVINLLNKSKHGHAISTRIAWLIEVNTWTILKKSLHLYFRFCSLEIVSNFAAKIVAALEILMHEQTGQLSWLPITLKCGHERCVDRWKGHFSTPYVARFKKVVLSTETAVFACCSVGTFHPRLKQHWVNEDHRIYRGAVLMDQYLLFM